MNTSLAQFMKVAVTAIAISALLFIVGYRMIDQETTGTTGYKGTIEGVTIPTVAVPSGAR